MSWELAMALLPRDVKHYTPDELRPPRTKPVLTHCAVCNTRLEKKDHAHTQMYCSRVCKKEAARNKYQEKRDAKNCQV